MLPRYRKTLVIYHQGLYHDINIYHDIELTITFARQTYFKCIPQAKATLVYQGFKCILLLLYTVETSGWHYIETLKPPSLLWGWLVYHTTPSTHNLIKCHIPYVWPPPHRYTKRRHYCATIDITDWYRGFQVRCPMYFGACT